MCTPLHSAGMFGVGKAKYGIGDEVVCREQVHSDEEHFGPGYRWFQWL